MNKPINPTTCTHKNAYREKGRRGSTGDYICPDCEEFFSSGKELQDAKERLIEEKQLQVTPLVDNTCQVGISGRSV